VNSFNWIIEKEFACVYDMTRTLDREKDSFNGLHSQSYLDFIFFGWILSNYERGPSDWVEFWNPNLIKTSKNESD